MKYKNLKKIVVCQGEFHVTAHKASSIDQDTFSLLGAKHARKSKIKYFFSDTPTSEFLDYYFLSQFHRKSIIFPNNIRLFFKQDLFRQVSRTEEESDKNHLAGGFSQSLLSFSHIC
jgi:hypothetical protein